MALTSSYSHGASDLPLLGETIGANLARTAARLPGPRSPGGLALRTALDLRRAARRGRSTVAAGLLAQGVKKGDRVGIWSPNCPEWVAVQFGTALIGAILVNVNPGLPGDRAGVRAAPGGRLLPGQRHPAQDQRLPGHGGGGPARDSPTSAT